LLVEALTSQWTEPSSTPESKRKQARFSPVPPPSYQSGGLLTAAKKGNTERLEELLALGVLPDDPKEQHGSGGSPLVWACGKGHLEVVRILLASGADVQAMAKNGITGLVWAASQGNLEICRLMLKAGADLTSKCATGENAREWAVELKYQAVVELIDSFASV